MNDRKRADGDVRIAAIRTLRVNPRVRPELVVRGAKGAHDRSDFLLVQICADDGECGYGEVSATPLWSGEDGVTAEHFVRDLLGPALIGRSVDDLSGCERLMDRLLAGNPFTKAGVSTALCDLAARVRGVCLAQLLGGVLRRDIPIKLSLSGDGPRLDVVHAAAVAAGFGAFKVKVGIDVEADVERVRRARDLAGPDGFLGVDANGGWTRAQARTAIRAMLPMRIDFVEQPVAAHDLEGMAELRAQILADSGVLLVADESVFGLADLDRVIRSKAADVVSIYVGKAAGPRQAVEMARRADAEGLSCVLGSNGELGLGAAAQLQVAAAAPGLRADIPSDIIGAHYYTEDVLARPLPSTGRRVTLPAGAGLGARPRADLIERFR